MKPRIIHGLVGAPFTTVSHKIERDSSRDPGRPAVRFTRERDHENSRRTAILGGYAPALARHHWEPVEPDTRKGFVRVRFQPGCTIDSPWMTREARA